jgi:predicted phage tail component-like protein
MYDFTTMQASFEETIDLPSVAFLFDGKVLESEIPGYRTLTVSGRETLSYDLETSGKISGRDGELILNKTLPARIIKVQYRLEADSNESFQYFFKTLNHLLHTTADVPVIFRDDPETTYYGQVGEMSEVPPESNNVMGTFNIYCGDSYRYDSASVFSTNPATISMSSPYPAKPDQIEITLVSSAAKITVDNTTTGKHVILNGTYTAGDVIVIDITDNNITKNGQNIMNNLDYIVSDFHRFAVKNGDTIQTTPINAAMEITVRGRWK